MSFERELALVEREREKESPVRLGMFGGVGATMLLVGIFSWSVVGPQWGAVLVGVGLGLLRVSLQGRRKEYETVTRRGMVRITSEGVKAAGRSLVKMESIKEAYYQPRPGAIATVRCLGASHEVLFEAEVESEDEAREVLRALGRDVSQGRSSFEMTTPILDSMAGRIVVVFAIFALIIAGIVASGFWKLLPIGGVLALMTMASMSQSVQIGVDGVLVSWLGRTRFVRYDAIVRVTKGLEHVTLVLNDGSTVKLYVVGGKADGHEQTLRRDAFVARLAEARAQYDGAVASRAVVAAVARGDRDVGAWRSALGRIQEQGYRETAAREEDLWRVVEDTSAPEDARAGAAVALRKGEGAMPRLRIAAEAVASPRLRVALERAADPDADDEIVDEALGAFEREA